MTDMERDALVQVLDALAQVRDYCPVDEAGRQLLGAAMQRLRPGDEPECAGVPPRAEARTDDCRPGGE